MFGKKCSLRSATGLLFVALLSYAQAGDDLVDTQDIYPTSLQANSTSKSTYSNSSTIALSKSNPAVVVDYGTESAGFPFIEVASISAPGVQVELRYTEGKEFLDYPGTDGPFTFSNGLTNTFRVETFNVTQTGRVQSFFLQGGFRWQGIKVLGDASITISRVGLASTSDDTPLDELPGHFESSNDTLNQIWGLGARAAQQSCLANGSAPSTWEITEEGTLIPGQEPAVSAIGSELSTFSTAFSNYTMTFSTKIVRGGTGWRVVAGSRGYGPYLVLTSEYPDGTFLNTNRTLLPPNTLVTGFGFSLVNVTTLTTGPVVRYPLDFDIKENEWYRISTTVNSTGYSVSINGSTPIFVSNAIYLSDWSTNYKSSMDPTLGTIGFGPFQDQSAYVRDVVVTARNGTIIYQNSMTNESTLAEYGVAPLTSSVCVDGSKRDRLVWSGDFLHTSFILSHSTNRTDFLSGTLEFLLDWKSPSGTPYANLAGMEPRLGSSPEYVEAFLADYSLLDYQFLFLAAAGEYYQHYGADALTVLSSRWDEIKAVATAVLPLVTNSTGLISTSATFPGAFFFGTSNGAAPSAAFVYGLRRIAAVATALGDNSSATLWTAKASAVAAAINKQLWDPTRGTWAYDTTTVGNSSSVAGTAFAILGGVANTSQALSAIAALEELRCGVGYKDSSSVECTSSTLIAPNSNGLLLRAVASLLPAASSNTTSTTAAVTTVLTHLLTHEWPAMLQPLYDSGASWEYMTPGLDGSAPVPGYDAYTSLSHPWGGAPTYVLPMYVLGVRPTAPGFTKWEAVVPAYDAVRKELGVSWAKGRVPVPGGCVSVEWKWSEEGVISVNVTAPSGTTGQVSVGGRSVKGQSLVSVEGGAQHSVEFELV